MPHFPGQPASRSIVIADDHPFVCDALARLVAFQIPLTETITANSFDEMLGKAEHSQQISGFCIDYLMPGFGDASKLTPIRRSYPEAAIVIVSAVEDDVVERDLLQAGADAFLSKSLDCNTLAEQLATHIRKYGADVPRTTSSNRSCESLTASLPELTGRETVILEHLCRGLSNREIGTGLGLAEPTVKMHLTNIFQKLGVRSRSEAIARCVAGRGALSHD